MEIESNCNRSVTQFSELLANTASGVTLQIHHPNSRLMIYQLTIQLSSPSIWLKINLKARMQFDYTMEPTAWTSFSPEVIENREGLRGGGTHF